MPISSSHPVHSNAGEGVVYVGLQEDRPLAMGQHGVVHEWVVASKLDHIVGEILGGAEGAKGFAGALQGQRAE